MARPPKPPPAYARQFPVGWSDSMQANAVKVRDLLRIPPIEVGRNAWRSKAIRAAMHNVIDELNEQQPMSLATLKAYVESYVDEVWGKHETKDKTINIQVTPDMDTEFSTFGDWIKGLKADIPFLKSHSGYNRTMLLYIALERYARKLELMKED